MGRIYNLLRLGFELERLYDSEINVRIQSFYDTDWQVWLGDNTNGYQKPDWDCCELSEVVPAIRELARKHYPSSKYVKNL